MNKETNSSPRVLVVDDEAHLRELLEITLIKMGLDVESAGTLEQARAQLQRQTFHLILTDMRLPDGSGLELVQEVCSQEFATPIAVITAFGSADNAVEALKAGAFDYVSKPVALEQLRKLVRSALEVPALATSEASPQRVDAPLISSLVGESAAIVHVRSQIDKLARSMAPVIITGESGTGKELAARAIHKASPRASKPFIAVNCGAIPENLMEAEFFGYRKGAFTGAVDDRDGFFQAANGGTLMLDEVADLPLSMQVKLLRAIQERSVRKVGATSEEGVDVRIISATHQNLAGAVTQGKFRQDLFYRLNVIELHLPPLRERRHDIEILTTHLLKRLSKDAVRISASAMELIRHYEFPGNVRELENILERALAFANNHEILPEDLGIKSLSNESLATSPLPIDDGLEMPVEVTPQLAESVSAEPINARAKFSESESPIAIFHAPKFPFSLPQFMEQVETQLIRKALEQTCYNRTNAAELLGISFRQLRYQIQKYNISDPDGELKS